MWLPSRPGSRPSQEGDAAPIISRHGLAGTDEACRRALDLFASIYGAEAGNLALKVLATGGVYLGGGIPPRILTALSSARFMESFLKKGRLSDVLVDFPVHVILYPRAALLGAACHGLEGFDSTLNRVVE